jgi:polar amino acid transport system substrate-binding protein
MKRRTFLTAATAAIASAPIVARAQSGEAMVDQVKQRGALRVGMSTFVPWAMRDKTGNLIGYEIDVGTRLAQDLGVRYEAVPTAWDGIIPALLAGRFDVIIGGMTITEQRAQQVQFTEPYSFSGQAIVANRRLAPDWKSLEQFNSASVTISARRGTTAVTATQQHLPKATIRQFDDDAQALQEVLNGRAHALVSSAPKPAFAAIEHAQTLYLPIPAPFTEQQEAMALRKNDAKSLAALNDWVKARHADGFLKGRRAYWFESRDWADRVAQS